MKAALILPDMLQKAGIFGYCNIDFTKAALSPGAMQNKIISFSPNVFLRYKHQTKQKNTNAIKIKHIRNKILPTSFLN